MRRRAEVIHTARISREVMSQDSLQFREWLEIGLQAVTLTSSFVLCAQKPEMTLPPMQPLGKMFVVERESL